MSDEHCFLKASATRDQCTERAIALELMAFYRGERRSRRRWLEVPPAPITAFEFAIAADPIDLTMGRGTTRREWTSKPISLVEIERSFTGRAFDHQRLNLHAPLCDWLDRSLAISWNGHALAVDGTHALTLPLDMPVKGFPLRPRIDREGGAINSFQTSILKRIVTLRTYLVDHSTRNDAIDDDWLQALRKSRASASRSSTSRCTSSTSRRSTIRCHGGLGSTSRHSRPDALGLRTN